MTDLEYPTSPSDYRSGFFGADYRSDPAAAYTNWIDPGDRFYRVRYGLNADDSKATDQDISDARTQWNGLTQCQRWRVRLHHEASLRWVHDNQPKVWVYYHTGIPAAKKSAIVNCLDPGTFEFLGGTFAEVVAKLEARAVGLSEHFWPGRNIDVVVFGWESDFWTIDEPGDG